MGEARTKGLLLIIDDDELFCDATRDLLRNEELEVQVAHTGRAGMEMCAARRVDVVLLDQNLPDAEGHTLCPGILEHNDQSKIIFVTAHPSFETAVKALRAGADDYLSKPFETEELRLAVERALHAVDLEHIAAVERYRHEKATEQSELVGESSLFGEIRELVSLAASSEAPVLITGETGTGKTHIARAIHYSGLSAGRTFMSTNCAALPENLIEAELFGAEKGAFTGAQRTRRGIFEMAEGGTMFLDEIGEMPFNLQSKLLGVLEDKHVRRLGGSTLLPVDVRVIAATSKDLEEELDRSFRRDLYYRLSVMRIHIPPLRDRRGDIPPLCMHLLSDLTDGKPPELPEDELRELSAYDWPGNVRELRNVLERSVIMQLKRGERFQPSRFIDATGRASRPSTPPPSVSPVHGDPEISLEDMEKTHIGTVLARNEGNLTQTAKTLGIALSTLKRKLKRYGLR
jgi:DNA-binding NtrC family response regulator